MAASTYKTYLMIKEGGSYTKLIDIKDYPDLGGEPELLETTTLSDSMQTYVPGIQSLDALTFTANYEKAKYAELKELENKDNGYAVFFGDDTTGADGKFEFEGRLSVFVNGGGVNEVRGMTITIAPSTVITMA